MLDMNRDYVKNPFESYEDVPGMLPCMKLPLVVHAMKINEPFRVNSLEGNYKQGKPGDYLMKGVDGELYICDADVFYKTYGFLGVVNNRRVLLNPETFSEIPGITPPEK